MKILEGISNRNKAYGTLAILVLLAIIFWKYSDQYANWTITANVWEVLIVNLLINPSYIILIAVLWNSYKLRGLLAGILLSLYSDVVSLSHSIPMSGVMPTDPAFFSYADTLFYKIIYPLISGPTAVFILYVIIPGILVYAALRIIRKTSSFNRVIKEAI